MIFYNQPVETKLLMHPLIEARRAEVLPNRATQRPSPINSEEKKFIKSFELVPNPEKLEQIRYKH